jgi:H+/Cl- antiporter ClcA
MAEAQDDGNNSDESRLGTTTEGLGISPSSGPVLVLDHVERRGTLLQRRDFLICLFSVILGGVGAAAAIVLMKLIGLVTNLCFYGRFSFAFSNPTAHYIGLGVIAIPIIGSIIVGIMARFGSEAIRGHGIPEAMESILLRQSRIPARLTWLKPLSAVISIGTGGPFGAEGPIIATGGAIGSLLGQIFHTSSDERKTLLAAGAAAGMAATFGAPISSVLMAVELLLFEFRPRSLIPVALASAVAAGLRIVFIGAKPIFFLSHLPVTDFHALLIYTILGGIIGLAAALVTRVIYLVEEIFEHHLPIHWMWWPAVGAVAVGICGYVDARTMGVGYYNISAMLTGKVALGSMAALCILKWISWSASLGSGTSGGTLAPLFTIGSSLGAILAVLALRVFPHLGISVAVAALVGMAAMFTGSTRAILTSIVFAVETTMQPGGFLPLLAGCSASFLVSCLVLKDTILTEKISRRGVFVPGELTVDFLDKLRVEHAYTRKVVTIAASDTVRQIRQRLFTHPSELKHHGFPVLDDQQHVLGVVSYRDIADPKIHEDAPVRQIAMHSVVTIFPTHSLRHADTLMAKHDIGRLIVVEPKDPHRMIGIITRSDLLKAHRRHS